MAQDGAAIVPRKAKFAEWIQKYGVRAIARDLNPPVTHVAVWHWKEWALGRKGTPPAAERVWELVRLSRGRLEAEDIVEQA